MVSFVNALLRRTVVGVTHQQQQQPLSRTLFSSSLTATTTTTTAKSSRSNNSNKIYKCFSFSSMSNQQQGLIINVVGADRLGIVSDMTKHVTDAGGNVGESQAVKLGSYFSLMMKVDLPKDNVETLTSALKTLTDLNATVYAVDNRNDTIAMKPTIAYTGRFVLKGADHPGIVHKVTSVLARHGLSVDRMDTSDQHVAPHGGVTLFRMSGIVHAYEPLAKSFHDELQKCKDELETLGDMMNCDIVLNDTDETFVTAFYGE